MLARRPLLAAASAALFTSAAAPGCLLDASPYASAGGTGLQAGSGGGGEGGAPTTTGAGASTSSDGSGGGASGPGGGGSGGTGAAGGAGGAGGTGGAGGAGGTGGAGGGPTVGDKCPGEAVSLGVYGVVTLSNDTALFADDYGSGVCGGGDAPDIVYEVKVTGKGLLTLDLAADPPYEGFLHLRKVCDDPNQQIDCSDEPMQLQVEAQDVIYVFVDGKIAQPSGTFDLQISLDGCGNGIIELAEECDDGNKILGDGCDSECLVTCTSQGSGTTDSDVFLDPETLRCYLLSYSPNKTWGEAQSDCVAWGGHLAGLSTTGEITDVLPLLSGTFEDVWIGGNDTQVDGQFTWVNGEPWSYVNGQPPWNHSSEPNGATNENCLEIYKEGGLNDAGCSTSQNYLCERPPPGMSPPAR